MVSKRMSMDRSVSHITLEKLEERGKLRKIKETKKRFEWKIRKVEDSKDQRFALNQVKIIFEKHLEKE